MNPNWKLIQIQAEALTPFYYHGLYAPDGSMTRPDIVTDTAGHRLCLGIRLRLPTTGPPAQRTGLWRRSALSAVAGFIVYGDGQPRSCACASYDRCTA
jgi:hypothetical protein